MTVQVYQEHKKLTETEKVVCNALVKDYDDTTLKQKIVDWWNTKHPTNTVQINPDVYKIDLIGIDNPHFAIELERSYSWKSHHRPMQFNVVRIPMRKTHYWLRKDVEAVFLQTNHDVTSCVLLTDDVIRNKYYNRILKTNVGYKEHFLEYYTWQYHEITL